VIYREVQYHTVRTTRGKLAARVHQSWIRVNKNDYNYFILY
jgi:hypothetical protein